MSSVAQYSGQNHPRPNPSLVTGTYSFTIKQYQQGDGIEALLLLGLSYDSAKDAFDRSYWLYDQNPAGSAIVCVMQHNESQENVGLLVICQRQIWTSGGIASAGIFCDLVTEKGHRTLGPALKLMEQGIKAADEYQLNRVYSLPNPNSVVLFKRLPKARSGEIHKFTRYFDWKAQLDSRMPKPAAFIASKILGVTDTCFRKVSQAVGSCFFNTRETDQITQDYDELWSTARMRFQEIGVRDAQFLDWRFGEISTHTHEIFSIYSRNENKLAGYAAYHKYNEDTLEISDFLACDGAFTERALFNAFSAFARKKGYEKVSVWFSGNSKTTRNLMLSGFIRVDKQTMNCRYTDNSVLSHDLSQTHITRADQDCG